MPYEVNATIYLPAQMGSAQICELNIGRYNSFDSCKEAFHKTDLKMPKILSAVVETLATELNLEPISFRIRYFMRSN